ncbi:ADP-ribosyltransferase [Streptomyces litchfieldiae]|uniref:ADP-ribosyltransferase n=1 Tax=Streptomyces litchfieldiae TaxID=3075543 RepID=A0ABU2MIL5_9ACTN|nr:ADP-ribosyltransferase [Streptomyces sp. DSM 44938]MDT0341311.1 ADP-ribosyltransferase [Streptomyces sp. DSM 44938]
MITTRILRRAAAVALPLALLFSSAAGTVGTAGTATAAVACPTVTDPLHAAATTAVDVERITPEPSYRTDCRQLYRAETRAPQVIFEEGFHPKDPVNGQYDLVRYVLVNQPSPFVSTTYDHDLYKDWGRATYNYYIDAPGGIDVNATIGDQHRWADQVEVAFPGGVDRAFIVGACPIDRATHTEIMSECVDNPHYRPWRAA